MSASIREFPDAGIIYAIEDNYGDDGYADVHDVSEVLGMEDTKGLRVRLSWMSRFKMVERHRREPGRWRVASKGVEAVTQAQPALDEIKNAGRVEFDLIRRTVQHYTGQQNGRRSRR